ncbi:MAG: DUF6912 family protein [Beutenbergiaceae bacterium]
MRIYLPASVADLAEQYLSPRAIHLVSANLRSAHPDEGEEDLEVVAFLLAADTSLTQLGRQDIPARVVIAADVAPSHVAIADGPDPTAAALTTRLPWSAVVSIHVDDPDDAEAAQTLRAAIEGHADAQEAAADLDLLWFDVSERQPLRALFGQ